MALRHFKEYYKQVEKQYLRMLEDSKEYDKLLKEGKVDPEQVEQVQVMLSKVTENYKRLTYIAYLMQLPNKKKKEAKHRDSRLEKALYIDKATACAVCEENEDILKNFKKQLEEIKNG